MRMISSRFLCGLLGSSLVLSAGFVGEVQAQLPAAPKAKADETPKPVPDRGPEDGKNITDRSTTSRRAVGIEFSTSQD